MKSKKAISIIMAGCIAVCMSGCSANTPPRIGFSADEYALSSGECISAQTNAGGKITYSVVGSLPAGVTLDPNSGAITFDSDVAGGTQILVRATSGELSTLPVVVKLVQPSVKPQITFANRINYLLNGDAITALSKPAYSVTYELDGEYDGISIDKYTGVVHFDGAVANNTVFTVSATSNGYKENKDFIAKTAGFVTPADPVCLTEVGSRLPASLTLDFTGSPDAEFMSLSDGSGEVSSDCYTYDNATHTLTLTAEYLSGLNVGDSQLKIYTTAHAVTATIKKADMLISSASELASIRLNRENLSKYYVQTADIDLAEYLKGNTDGWYPIGEYHDVTDYAEATADAWGGTYDGNGHKITGGVMSRDGAEAYNSGLFGFTVSTSVIKNLGYEGSTHTVRSFSGTLVGVNGGLVSDCYSTVGVRAVLNDPTAKCRVIGGFVGRNNGTIKNCYAAGKVEADSDFGAFCGENNGTLENCYAAAECGGGQKIEFVGLGTKADSTNTLFDTYAQMKSHTYDFGDVWVQESGSLPTLNGVDKVGYARRITIKKQAEYFTCGDEFQVEFTHSPATLSSDEQFTFDVKGEGVRINADGVVNTRNASCNEFTVIVNSKYASGEYTYKLYDRAESVEVIQPDTVLRAGRKYALSGRVLPDTAYQDGIKYELIDPPTGVSLAGNIIAVSETADDSLTVKYRAMFGKVKGETITATVKGTVAFDNNSVFFGGQIDGDAVFTFPHGKVEHVRRSGKALNFTQDGNTVTVPKSELSRFGKGQTTVVIETAERSYRASVLVCDRVIRTADDLAAINESNATKKLYYVLANDIDLGGAEITKIGTYESDDDLDTAFTGTFDGAGHTISNFKVRGSHNVGFFGFLRGTVKDLHLRNGDVIGTGNFVGGLVGAASNATITNCSFTGTVVCSNAEAKAVGMFVGKHSGTITDCGAGGNLANFFGTSTGTISGEYTIDI